MAWRYSKSELAMESSRLWSWANHLKLLLIATLAYAFLLSLLSSETLRHWLLLHGCPRMGKRCRDASTPLYRLRSALRRLWLAYPPPAFSYLPKIRDASCHSFRGWPVCRPQGSSPLLPCSAYHHPVYHARGR